MPEVLLCCANTKCEDVCTFIRLSDPMIKKVLGFYVMTSNDISFITFIIVIRVGRLE